MEQKLQAKALQLMRDLVKQIESGKVVVADVSIETETNADTGAETGRRTLRLSVSSPEAKSGRLGTAGLN